jgi:hypothetical protein
VVGSGQAGQTRGVILFSKRSGRRAEVRFMPGCLVWSLILSIGLTVLLNLAIRAF